MVGARGLEPSDLIVPSDVRATKLRTRRRRALVWRPDWREAADLVADDADQPEDHQDDDDDTDDTDATTAVAHLDLLFASAAMSIVGRPGPRGERPLGGSERARLVRRSDERRREEHKDEEHRDHDQDQTPKRGSYRPPVDRVIRDGRALDGRVVHRSVTG